MSFGDEYVIGGILKNEVWRAFLRAVNLTTLLILVGSPTILPAVICKLVPGPISLSTRGIHARHDGLFEHPLVALVCL